jgi:sugar phosphate isomerase/epimerase
MKPNDPPLDGPKNNPMQPVAWTRLHKNEAGKENKILCTTMGSATDLASEDLRRMMVNGVYWALGLEVPARADVTLLETYLPTFYGFGNYRRGLKPENYALGGGPGLFNPFFAFDNGVPTNIAPEKLLKELGYDGWGSRGFKLADQNKAFRAEGLRVFNTYVRCDLDKTPAFDAAAFKSAANELRGMDVTFWLTMAGKNRGKEDDKAIGIVREIADLAAEGRLRVVLYPHTGDYTATTADALRLVKQIDRPNVGVSINLCHELRNDQGPKLSQTILEAMPYLMLVSINGAEPMQPGYGWDKLIQPLGKGSYDVLGFLKQLKTAGYRGPIGLQGYQIPGDKTENLRQSIKAWKEYSAQMGQ